MNRSKILYYLGSIVLALIASFIYDGIKHLPLLSGLKAFVSWFWSDVLRLKLELWVIVISFLVIYLIYKLINAKRRNDLPKFVNYTQDLFEGYNWTWYWYFNTNSGKWQTSQITPLCPDCQTLMHYKYGLLNCYQANCPRCGYQIGRIKSKEDIDALIIDNIRKNNFMTDKNNDA